VYAMTLSLPSSLVGFPSSARSDIITSLPTFLSGVNTLAEWVREARANKLAFREAVHEHERSSANPPSDRPYLPSAGRGGGKSRRGKSRGSRPLSSGKGGFNPTNQADLRVKPPSLFNVPSRIPRNLQSQVVWDVIKIDALLSVPTSGILEANSSFAFSSHPQVASWAALFDQFSIPQASMEFDSRMPPGSTNPSAMLYTALDFDSAASLGSIAAIEDFSTCEANPMTPAARHLRSVRPTVRSTTSSGNNLINKSMWVDSAAPTTLFYGIRAMLGAANAAYTVNVTTTIWFCFRNQI